MLRLLLARLLVERIPMRHWRGRLGQINPASDPIGAETKLAHALARAVERAAVRLPIDTKCLPRAMALHAMMRRRGLRGVLVIGVLDQTLRGSLEDLHAWVEVEGQVLIGALDQPFHPLIRFG